MLATKYSKLSFEQMINQLEDKGVTFNKTCKEDAITILEHSNFYYKVRSFRKNFDKNKDGKYTNLDFFILNDLATIDMRLRYVLIHMCLDLEHTIKTRIVRDITIDEKEDGKKVVEKFIEKNSNHKSLDDYYKPISNYRNPNHGIYKKFKNEIPPIWVFCELITFGELVSFVEFYCYSYKNKPKYYLPLGKNLKYIKNIRNLTAHNSPIINEITTTNQLEKGTTNRFLFNFLDSIDGVNRSSFRTKTTNIKVHDLCSLLYLYEEYIQSHGIKRNRYRELKEFMNRVKRNKDVYKKHENLKSIYNFFYKIVDNVSSKY